MIRWLVLLCLLPSLVTAQSREVRPGELTLDVIVEARAEPPFVDEMVLITIRGTYRRHITLEKLKQPDFDGFNWSQLGPDSWSEERERGRPVKILERRMAIFPKRAGELTVAPFVHELTLTDENDNWFEHRIQSPAFTISARPVPAEGQGDWWFPVRQLKVSDQWSNAPDQLKSGEGVLRVIHIEAVGVTPEMIPPMPELTSPSAMIFPHPEKRLVELSPAGPVTHAFWRWTLRPTNATSAIVEPLDVPYFDATTREHGVVTISAQRVAYDAAITGPAEDIAAATLQRAMLPGWPLWLLGAVAFAGAVAISTIGRTRPRWQALRRFAWADPLVRALRRAARRNDAAAMRRAGQALVRRDGPASWTTELLRALDPLIFSTDPDTRTDLQLILRRALDRREPAQIGP